MQRVRLGDVEFTVVEIEEVTDSATVTDNPVENGQDVSDHVKQNPSYINIRGQMIGEDAYPGLQRLTKYKEDGELLTYTGRNSYSNMVVEDISRVHGVQNKTGYSFDIKLKQVRVATAKQVDIKIANPSTKKADKKTSTKVKQTTNNGLQQTKSKSNYQYKVAHENDGNTSMKSIVSTYKKGLYKDGVF